MPERVPEIEAAYDGIAAVVVDRLSRNQRIRRNLPGEGRVRIDRQLPFLCVYRAPPSGLDAGTRDFVTTEAAYVFTSGRPEHQPGLHRLIHEIVATMHEHFGAFLIVEVWAEDDRSSKIAPRHATRPGFRIMTDRTEGLATSLEALTTGLRNVKSQGWAADVDVIEDRPAAPPGMESLGALLDEPNCYALGIAIRPVYRDVAKGAVYPRVVQSLRRQVATAIRKCVFAFAGHQGAPARGSHAHYQALGPSSLVKAARAVDQQLSEVSQAFDFVLQTVPLNTAMSWEEFAASGYTAVPKLYYRPLPYDSGELKRRLYEIPMERIEDVTLIEMFEEKQDHLDRQLTALKHIDAPPFFYDSLQLYGKPDAALVQLAVEVLNRTARQPTMAAVHERAEASEIVAAARDQIDEYRQASSCFVAAVELRNDIASALMVAKDRLYVSTTASLPRAMLGALLHHEVGTHLLTYMNGKQQPLQQLYAGLAGYEELQEGLAVLAEYLVGGLTRERLRTLACRVLAVESLVKGGAFLDTFRLLHEGHGQPPRNAYMTTLRVFRGGGLTKDAIYLRGLVKLVEYLHAGHDLEPLYVGKIGLDHVPLVRELRLRGIVQPPATLPRFLDDADVALRLARCREHSILELVTETP